MSRLLWKGFVNKVYLEVAIMNIKKYFNSENLQQLLVYISIAIVIITSIYIFFSFYVEIFLTLIFIVLVLIYRKKQ